MLFRLLFLVLCSHVTWMDAIADELAEVRHLTGEPDFRDVTLRWEYERQSPFLAGFQVQYCELQAWGPHRCRTKTIDDSSGHEVMTTANSRVRMYSVIISGLRMSTNYSFEVRPVEVRARSLVEETRLVGRSIVVPTKGFSARATQCLPHASEVEVLTGPHFGGRIAVEAADGERCAVDGDPNSNRDTYLLRINHEECGSHLNATTVATFVLVQENLPILTHSTRRFLVLCTYQPETLTVRAGINLPSQASREDPNNENSVDGALPEAIPYDASQLHLESVNEVQVSRMQHHRQIVETLPGELTQDNSVAQLVLMVILLVAGVFGCTLATWWFVPSLKKRLSARNHPVDHTSSISMYENFENSLRDTVSITSTDTDSLNLTQDAVHSNLRTHITEEDNSEPGVFSIRMPVAPQSTEGVRRGQRPCITIEHTSHSEA